MLLLLLTAVAAVVVAPLILGVSGTPLSPMPAAPIPPHKHLVLVLLHLQQQHKSSNELLSPGYLTTTGPSFATSGGDHFPSPTNYVNWCIICPSSSQSLLAPFQLPPSYKSGIPTGGVFLFILILVIMENLFYTTNNGQHWYKPKNNKLIYIDDGAASIKWSVKDWHNHEYYPGCLLS